MRKYYSEEFEPKNWEIIEKELIILQKYEINSEEDFFIFLEKLSEIGFIIGEYSAWKYIKMTCNADNPEYTVDFNEYYENVLSKTETYFFELDKKIYNSKYFNELGSRYEVMKMSIKNNISLFREENIPLSVKENELTTKYSELSSKLTVNFKGEEQTLVSMRKYLKDIDRSTREEAWNLIYNRLLTSESEFNSIFNELVKLREQISKNADFTNYRDYMHISKGRFDYSVSDIYEFHNSVKEIVVPFLKELNNEKREKLGVEILRPWDTDVDVDGIILKPFENSNELLDKMIEILSEINIDYGKQLERMKNEKLIDLDNRKGKANGGYNYPLEETGAAFIFMNSIGMHSDMVTLAHEAGHAIHSFYTSKLKLAWDRRFPSEVAELASMSMELITMEYWYKYYSDPKLLKKAKIEQLEDTLKILPWVMVVDKFQHWIYTNKNHSIEERYSAFEKIIDEYNVGVNWDGYDSYKKIAWFRQLHIFEVPFYYIEYAISQLGAIAIYKNYKENKDNSIKNYSNFLEKGYSLPIKKLYELAGIKFDFSKDYIKELVDFIKEELNYEKQN